MKKGPVYRLARVVIVLALSIAIAGILLKMQPKAERVEKPDHGRLVRVFPAVSTRLNMVVETYGTVRPRDIFKLTAEVRGRVVSMDKAFKEGLSVEKGGALIRIDPRSYQLEVEHGRAQLLQVRSEIARVRQEIRNIEARLDISKSDVALAKAEFFRLRALSDRKVAARTTLDKAEQRYLASLERLQGLENSRALTGPQLRKLEAREQAADVMRRQAVLNLERTRIIAPFEGWVLEKAVEIGQHVNVGQYLGQIHRKGAYEIEVGIPAAELKWLPPLMEGSGTPDAEIRFKNGIPRQRWSGHVARVKAGMDEKTRTLPVIVEVDDPVRSSGGQGIRRIRPGLYVTVAINGIELPRVFVLPSHLLHQGDTVFIADNGRLSIKPVHVLRRSTDSVYVDSGLEEGEMIIKTPVGGAVDGMIIRVGAVDP